MIFAIQLTNGIRHIAALLTALFVITLLPYNALHHHREEEHTAALLSHKKEHSCELDEAFCQEEFTGGCEHTSHISTTHVKCFTCQFHFIKAFDKPELLSAGDHIYSIAAYNIATEKTAFAFLHKLNNKGPPAVA